MFEFCLTTVFFSIVISKSEFNNCTNIVLMCHSLYLSHVYKVLCKDGSLECCHSSKLS